MKRAPARAGAGKRHDRGRGSRRLATENVIECAPPITPSREEYRCASQNCSALTGVAAVCACAAGSASAVPLHILVPHRFAQPPTTAQCEAPPLGRSRNRVLQPGSVRAGVRPEPAVPRAASTGAGKTIVIVDSFGSPTIQERPARSSTRTYGLPASAVVQDHRARRQPIPPYDPTDATMGGWAIETSLDVEYSHAIAPGANILLVETPVAETEGLDGVPGDRRGRELRHQPPSRRRHQPELRRHRGDVPTARPRSTANAARTTTRYSTTSRCSASSGDGGADRRAARRSRTSTRSGSTAGRRRTRS